MDDLTMRCFDEVRAAMDLEMDGSPSELQRLAFRLARMMAAGLEGFALYAEFWRPDAIDSAIRAVARAREATDG